MAHDELTRLEAEVLRDVAEVIQEMTPMITPETTLYLPIVALPAEGEQPQLAMRRSATGSLLALAFTSQEKLSAELGPECPWLAIPARFSASTVGAAPIEQFLIDPSLRVGDGDGTSKGQPVGAGQVPGDFEVPQ